MNSSEVRQCFLDFFKERGHHIAPSVSLMPKAPNLLFTNAGMNAFVPYFLGEQIAPYPRIANTQKCIRAGGKHNDLEDVGFDTYHHSFFEMLGNWSFGDYFKTEAIHWAWEFLTKKINIPKERLYASVYKPSEGEPSSFDQEAYEIWQKLFAAEGLDASIHIVFGGKKDNFWMMGDSGPCGPCSEIHIDLTPQGNTNGKLVNQDSPYCLEIWNLVFIQFNAETNGSLHLLDKKHVDTGMGLERLVGILAGTKDFTDFSQTPSNYSSDLFSELFIQIAHLSTHTYQGTSIASRRTLSPAQMHDCIFRVLADHIRSLTFAIADGILPGNEGRGYVLRRLLRRAVLLGKRISLKPGSFCQLASPLIQKMSPIFPELSLQKERIIQTLKREETSFTRTLNRGLQLFDNITKGKNTLSGENAFTLYDTYGFPLDLIQLIAADRNITVDLQGFENEMEKQRKRARSSHKKTTITITKSSDPCCFVGEDSTQLTDINATLTGLFREKENTYLTFSQTPFYAESGGQVGDTGTVVIGNQSINLLNTIKSEQGLFLHKISPDALFESKVGTPVLLTVNKERRKAIERHHSATHLLHWALREILGPHIEQAGSLVNENSLRFDFTHYTVPDKLHQIEALVNQRILENIPLRTYTIPFNQKPKECLAFFGDKYGDTVRMVEIGNFSKELCGGTHVHATGELGFFKIVSETTIAAGVRRIEAVTGEAAYKLIRQNWLQIGQLTHKLSCRPEELYERIEAILKEQALCEKELRQYRGKALSEQSSTLLQNTLENNNLKWILEQVKVNDANELRALAMQTIKKMGSGGVLLVSIFGGRATVLVSCSKEAIAAGYHAGTLVEEITKKLGGKGGGKANFAMGGAKDVHELTKVLETYRQRFLESR